MPGPRVVREASHLLTSEHLSVPGEHHACQGYDDQHQAGRLGYSQAVDQHVAADGRSDYTRDIDEWSSDAPGDRARPGIRKSVTAVGSEYVVEGGGGAE